MVQMAKLRKPMQTEFWLRPDSSRFGATTQPELTTEMIENTQRVLGAKLPDAYLKVLRELNGGRPQRDAHWFSKRDSFFGTHMRFRYLLGIPKQAMSMEYRSETRWRDRKMAWQRNLLSRDISVNHVSAIAPVCGNAAADGTGPLLRNFCCRTKRPEFVSNLCMQLTFAAGNPTINHGHTSTCSVCHPRPGMR
jgi:hypothetical protein